MFKNYLLVALRSFQKQKVYTLVNLCGLTIALTVAILAIFFIHHELSYDRWVPNHTNIYKVYRQYEKGSGDSATPNPLASTLPEEFPEVLQATRLTEGSEVLIEAEEKSLYADRIFVTDSSMLSVLSLPLQAGDPATALTKPFSVLLSNEFAQKLFGDEDPIGKSLRVIGQFDVQVTAVLAATGNTHLQADAIMNIPGVFDSPNWTNHSAATYVSLHPETDIPALEEKLTQGLNQHMQAEINRLKLNFDRLPDWRLQALTEVHLSANEVEGPIQGTGNKTSLYILAIVALVILAIASINYMNLATAQATSRAREVGVRKVSGATHPQLLLQFMAEALVQALVALPLAILLADLVLPAFESIVSRDLVLSWSLWKSIGGYLLLLVCIVGLLAGSYPAFFLSAYRPTDVLKGQWLRKDRGKVLRHAMVVAQFSGAMIAAIVMFFIYQQVQFMQNKALGFQPEQVVVVPLTGEEADKKLMSLKSEILQHSQVHSMTTTTALPGTFVSDFLYSIPGEENSHSIYTIFTTPDFAKTLNLEMREGQFFSDKAYDSTGAYVVNEAFVKKYGLKEPVGTQIGFTGGKPNTLVGVVKDFHFSSLKENIEPLVITTVRPNYRHPYAAFRIGTQNVKETLATIEQYYKQVEPGEAMLYSFLDDDFSGLYSEQERLGKTLLYATLLTLLIAAMGLFGLASYMAEQRTKEIGVRKVLGASVRQIVFLLGKDFLKLIIIAGVIASPIAFWLANDWLTNFAYQMDMTYIPFLLVILMTVLIAILTVSSRAIKAAKTNPVESLRNE